MEWMTGILVCMFALLGYIYLGYPAALWIASRVSRRKPPQTSGESVPKVSLIITAHNEEQAIASKVANVRGLDFPMERLEVILASDGSTDRTVARFERMMEDWARAGGSPNWDSVALRSQKGKSQAQNEAVEVARHEILVFTDAGAHFDPMALRSLAAAFSDPSVGCATGRSTYRPVHGSEAGTSEGLYWKYEVWLRGMENRLGILMMGSAWMLGLRRNLFKPLQPTEGDDWVLPLRTLQAGFRVVQVDRATVYDDVVRSSKGLFRTKVRIISKDYLSLWRNRHLLNPFRYGWNAIALLSHKFLRWWAFAAMLLAYTLSVSMHADRIGLWFFSGQTFFYALAAAGALAESRQWNSPLILKLTSAPYHFCVVQAASAVGIWKACTGRAEAFWQPIREVGTADA